MLGKLLQERYQIVQVLSAGGFCQTYLAEDISLPDHPTCLIKHMLPTSEYPEVQTFRRLFTREVEALSKLDKYDWVPQLLAHFEQNQQFYLVQEFIVGHSLSAELQPGQIWTESQVVELLQEVLGILEFVHQLGMIHRDIKPSNLLRRHQDGRLVLIDFGSVKQAGTQVVTAQGQTNWKFAIGIPATIAIGTPGYMPAEQGRGRPHPNSDIYALGMIGIQALTGLNPTQLLEDADTGEIIWHPQIQVSAGLTCVLNKMVRYHFRDRYQSVTEVLQALQHLATLSVIATPQNQAQPQDTISVVRSDAPCRRMPISDLALPYSRVSDLALPLALGGILRQALGLKGGLPLRVRAAARYKSASLLGMTILTLVALIGGSYYLMRSLPATQVQQNPVASPTPNTANENITFTKTLSGHSDSVWSVALSSEGQTLVSSSQDKTIKLWHLDTGMLHTLTGHSEAVWSVAISPDGQIASGSSDNTIKLWNLNTGKLLHTLTGHSAAVWSVAISPDGQIASGSSDNTIKLWNLNTGKLLRTLVGHSQAVRSIAISPDGQIASGSSDNTIKLWNLSSGKLLQTFLGHTNRVISVALSPKGQLLASGSADKTIKIWHLSSGRLLHTLSRNSHWANAVAISPDGRIVAGGIGDMVKVWDLNTGELLHKMSGHSSDITSICFSANGKQLVSGSRDRTIKIWRL